MNENKTGKEIWSFNSGELPDVQNTSFDELKIESSISGDKKEAVRKSAVSFSEKTLTARCVILCLIFTALGVMFSFLMRDLYPIAEVERTALSHFFDGKISPFVYGLRIFFSGLPTVILLMLAGFTYFSGALTSFLLALNSAAAGVGISTVLLYFRELGEVGISASEITVYVAWVLFELALLVLLACASRHTAGRLHRKENSSTEKNRALALELTRKYALFTVLYIALCVAYTATLTLLS